jgi:hypothetical protein
LRNLFFILLATAVLIGCSQDTDKYEFAGYDRASEQYRIFDKKAGILYEIDESEREPGKYFMRMIGPAGVFTRWVTATTLTEE